MHCNKCFALQQTPLPLIVSGCVEESRSSWSFVGTAEKTALGEMIDTLGRWPLPPPHPSCDTVPCTTKHPHLFCLVSFYLFLWKERTLFYFENQPWCFKFQCNLHLEKLHFERVFVWHGFDRITAKSTQPLALCTVKKIMNMFALYFTSKSKKLNKKVRLFWILTIYVI